MCDQIERAHWCWFVCSCERLSALVPLRALTNAHERTHTHTHTSSAPHLPGTVQAGLPKPDNLKELMYRGKVTVSKFSKVLYPNLIS